MAHAETMQAFDKDAQHYDALRRTLIPCYDLFYGTVITLIEAHGVDENARILYLGAGTGLLSEHILTRWPQAHIHLLDGSEAMVAQARGDFTAMRGSAFKMASSTRRISQAPGT